MSKISIHNWKQTDIEGSAFQFMAPEYHPTYWEVPKWWYRGDRTVYTSCARVDVNDTTSIYIDGTTPLMQITIDWDDDNAVSFDNVRDIRRILVCAKDNYGAVIRGDSDEYTDIEMLQGNFYKVRYDNYFGPDVIEPLQEDIKPVWVNGNNYGPFYQDPIPFITGTFVGGIEPVTYEVRHKELINNKWTTPTDFSPQTNTPTERILTLDTKSKAQKIHIETRATDAEGTIAYCNGPYLDVDNPVPTITAKPAVSARNLYEEGQILTGFAGDFEGGLPDAEARCRWQHRASKDDPWSSFGWTRNVTYLQQIDSDVIPVGTVQVRFQYQIVELSTNTGNGARNINNSIERDISPAAPPSANWGAVIVYINGEEYNTFVGAPYNVIVGEPQDLKVEWEGNATGTTLWSQRAGGNASFDDATSATPVVTLNGSGSTTLTITLTDPSGLADPTTTSKVVNFWAASA